jgi:Ca2+:H+ antiporter
LTEEGKKTSLEEVREVEEEEEEDILGFNYSLVWLALITVGIAFLSDALAETIQGAADSAGISGVFLSAIILPIVGNAAEHAGAVMFAVKNRLDLTIGFPYLLLNYLLLIVFILFFY